MPNQVCEINSELFGVIFGVLFGWSYRTEGRPYLEVFTIFFLQDFAQIVDELNFQNMSSRHQN